MNGLEAAGVEQGLAPPQEGLIFGAGPIGLLLGLALQAAGTPTVTFADINDQRLEFAAGLGFSTTRPDAPALRARRRDFDFVADATGIPSPLSKA